MISCRGLSIHLSMLFLNIHCPPDMLSLLFGDTRVSVLLVPFHCWNIFMSMTVTDSLVQRLLGGTQLLYNEVEVSQDIKTVCQEVLELKGGVRNPFLT